MEKTVKKTNFVNVVKGMLLNGSLTKKEKQLLTKISTSTVLLTGRPGEAKSAIFGSILTKCGFNESNYLTLDLMISDSIDLGKFPSVLNGQLEFIPPKYLVQFFEKASQNEDEMFIIHFEELTRCAKDVRDACLRILNERVFAGLTIPENVRLICSSNLGDEDGTSIDCLDSALINRLQVVKYNLTFQEWVEGFAKENVNKYILQFLDQNINYFKTEIKENEQFCSPRSWTNLSKCIDFNLSLTEDESLENYIEIVMENGNEIIGKSSFNFINYLKTLTIIKLDDIVKAKSISKLTTTLDKVNRDLFNSLVLELKERNVNEMTVKQIENVKLFLQKFEESNSDVIGGYIIGLMDKISNETFIKNKGLNVDDIKENDVKMVKWFKHLIVNEK